MEGPGAIPALGCIPERRRCCSKTAPLNGSGMGGRVGGKRDFLVVNVPSFHYKGSIRFPRCGCFWFLCFDICSFPFSVQKLLYSLLFYTRGSVHCLIYRECSQAMETFLLTAFSADGTPSRRFQTSRRFWVEDAPAQTGSLPPLGTGGFPPSPPGGSCHQAGSGCPGPARAHLLGFPEARSPGCRRPRRSAPWRRAWPVG